MRVKDWHEAMQMAVVESENRTEDKTVRRWKLIGLGLLGIPILIVTALTIGEGIGGEEGWWGHLIQLAVGLAITAGAWYFPRVGGPVLAVVGTLLTVMMLTEGEDLVAELSSIALLFAPLIVAGVFFTLAGQADRRGDAPQRQGGGGHAHFIRQGRL